MGTVPTFVDMHSVAVEHMLGQTAGPLVKLRVSGVAAGSPVLTLGEMSPVAARQIAADLMAAAARAEYEADFVSAHAEFCTGAGIDVERRDMFVGMVLQLVRTGEQTRHTSTGGDQ